MARRSPLRVSFADGKHAAVPYVDGDEHLLALMGSNSAFPENHFVGIDVVVDGVKSIHSLDAKALEYNLRHPFTASAGKPLANLYVVEVVCQILSIHKAEVFRDGRLMAVPVQRLQRALDLPASACGFVFGNERVALCEIFLFAFVEVNGEALVVFRHLLSKIAGAGVDDQILRAVSRLIDLNKMVSAAQCAEAALQAFCVLQTSIAVQLCQVKTFLPSLPGIHAGGDIVRGGIHLLHVDLDRTQTDCVHTAPDIHAHDIGDCLVGDSHGGADRAALPGMDIRHDADSAIRCERIVAHPANLLDGLILDDFRKAEGCIHFPFDFHHLHHSLT